jgi:SNF2 family DNA or RNA helicase
MDEVGLGKTLQIVAFICFLTWYRDYYARHNDFPGRFGMLYLFDLVLFRNLKNIVAAGKLWQGKPGNIPNLPSLLIAPVTLVDQVISELHRYLRHGTFDVLPYLGTWERRKLWWTDIWDGQCKNTLGKRIIIVTPAVSHIIPSHSEPLLTMLPS